VEADAGPTPQQQRQALIQQVLLALLLYVIPDTSPVAAPACTWRTERGAAPAVAHGARASMRGCLDSNPAEDCCWRHSGMPNTRSVQLPPCTIGQGY
jgi:hypothetical protein